MTLKHLAYGLLVLAIGLGWVTTLIGVCACPLESLALQRAFVYFSAATIVCALVAVDRLALLPTANRLVLGIVIGLLPLALFWLVLLAETAQPQIREASARTQMTNNGKQMGLALHSFHDEHKRLPLDVHNAGNPKLSWRVSICPYVEQNHLYKQFDLTQAWDSPANRPLVEKIPSTFSSVLFPEPGNTPWQGFVGPGTAFEPGNAGLRLKDDFPDGLSNTILIVEAQQQAPWTKPADIPYGPGVPLPPLGQDYLQRGEWPFRCSVRGEPRFHVCLGDGTVRTLSADISEEVLRALIVRNDGKP